MNEQHPALTLALRQATDDEYEILDHAAVNPILGGPVAYVYRRLTAKEKLDALRAVLPFVVAKLGPVDPKTLSDKDREDMKSVEEKLDAFVKKHKKANP